MSISPQGQTQVPTILLLLCAWPQAHGPRWWLAHGRRMEERIMKTQRQRAPTLSLTKFIRSFYVTFLHISH